MLVSKYIQNRNKFYPLTLGENNVVFQKKNQQKGNGILRCPSPGKQTDMAKQKVKALVKLPVHEFSGPEKSQFYFRLALFHLCLVRTTNERLKHLKFTDDKNRGQHCLKVITQGQYGLLVAENYVFLLFIVSFN